MGTILQTYLAISYLDGREVRVVTHVAFAHVGIPSNPPVSRGTSTLVFVRDVASYVVRIPAIDGASFRIAVNVTSL